MNNGKIYCKGGKGAKKGNDYGTGICSSGGNGGYGRIRIDCLKLNNNGNIEPNVGYNYCQQNDQKPSEINKKKKKKFFNIF